MPEEGTQSDVIVDAEEFPMDLKKYQTTFAPNPWDNSTLSAEQRTQLQQNIELCRDAIVLITSVSGASGYGGHTGGAFDMMPEVCLLDGFFRAAPERFVQILFDEAGHRVVTQYLFASLRGHLPAAHLLKYRQGHSRLPGHPELGHTPGVRFSSGRLGHLWAMANGVAMANPSKVIPLFSSDGSQMEGNTAEAARFAAAKNLNVKLFIDDNDVTIAGHPSQYLTKFDVAGTLRGHGIAVQEVNGEDLDALFVAMQTAVTTEGPYAVVLKRPMCPGIHNVEGTPEGHDAIAKASALKYLGKRGLEGAADCLHTQKKKCADPHEKYLGSGKFHAARQTFGKEVVAILKQLPEDERKRRVVVVDSDLEGSCGLKIIREACPEVYQKSGVMERGNFSACAGFGFDAAGAERQGVFGTFAAFQEMIISEVTMARLNRCNVLLHFSHSGVDDMSDNMCHFGQNNFFADGGLADEGGPRTQLFWPADAPQMRKIVSKVFWDRGLRFVYSTRSKTPEILRKDQSPFYGQDYQPVLGTDDAIREGTDGYIVSYGDALYRSLDAVERLQAEGISVGLINKWHLNAVDEDTLTMLGTSGLKFILVAESLNTNTGLGVRFGTWMLERGYSGFRYARCGTHRAGCGGQWEHAYWQGYDPESVMGEVRKLMKV